MGVPTQIKFGTDGWRGVIAEDFTFDNVRIAAAAIGSYVLAKEDPSKGVCIGYDTRFGSRDFAVAAAKVISAMGIPVVVGRPVYADSGALLCGAASGRGRWSDDHFQPQPRAVEWGEVQGLLWGIGQPVDHGGDCDVSRRSAGGGRRSRDR